MGEEDIQADSEECRRWLLKLQPLTRAQLSYTTAGASSKQVCCFCCHLSLCELLKELEDDSKLAKQVYTKELRSDSITACQHSLALGTLLSKVLHAMQGWLQRGKTQCFFIYGREFGVNCLAPLRSIKFCLLWWSDPGQRGGKEGNRPPNFFCGGALPLQNNKQHN